MMKEDQIAYDVDETISEQIIRFQEILSLLTGDQYSSQPTWRVDRCQIYIDTHVDVKSKH